MVRSFVGGLELIVSLLKSDDREVSKIILNLQLHSYQNNKYLNSRGEKTGGFLVLRLC